MLMNRDSIISRARAGHVWSPGEQVKPDQNDRRDGVMLYGWVANMQRLVEVVLLQSR